MLQLTQRTRPTVPTTKTKTTAARTTLFFSVSVFIFTAFAPCPTRSFLLHRHRHHPRSSSHHQRTSAKQQQTGRFLPLQLHMSSSAATQEQHRPPEHVVIAGAGIIGTATAFYLAVNHNIPSTLVDVTGTIAPAASGKAGGFLARDWNDYTPTMRLTHRSFDLHQELADTLGADAIQYRRLTCAAVSVLNNAQQQRQQQQQRRPKGKKLEGIEWADNASTTDDETASAGVATGIRSLGTESTIAQVHPKRLCEQLWRAAQKSQPGCSLRQGKVVRAVYNDNEKNVESFRGVQLDDGSVLDADALLLACGPWTTAAVVAASDDDDDNDNDSNNIMLGIKYHSAVVETQRVLRQCVFFSGCGDPEVYVRPDATAYCTGFPEAARVVTEAPGQERVDPGRIQTILDAVRQATAATATDRDQQQSQSQQTTKGDLDLLSDPAVEQACYLPTTHDGVPIMGKVREGVYMAAGHSCWGILLGPASGETMASLMATGQGTGHVDLRDFSPARLPNLQPVPSEKV